MKLSEKQIKEIADHLDSGMICYINKETKEIKTMIDFDECYGDTELWEEEFKEIEENFNQYLKIEKMPSREAFKIMEGFTEEVTNQEIRNRLIYALNRNKPFKNFKYEVDYNEEIRQHWFRFKAKKYQEWTKDYIKYNFTEREINENLEKTTEEPQIVMGIYDDDGNRYNPNLHSLPNLCMSCKKKDDPNEEIVCNLTRMDQIGEKEFRCYAYESLNE